MKIDRFSGPKTTSTSRGGRAAPSGGGGFARALAEGPSQSAAPAGSSPVSALNALLAVQEVGDSTEGRRRARRRAESLLDKLEELRIALMLGEVPLAHLENLAGMLKQHQETVDDPKLAQIINEIEIRAAVELAKRGR
ncbi:flagellar assembly protein FliX [Pelagibius marinus]|uniref:flagellar assembly protein FliX n=1 Tax=Pelagibius marinus TaxID=2762760 RepID=UPI001872904D|nr:flagellar assembly protein FliX [Pelagibius marinus]